jgi:hypothetical protein
MGNKEKSRIRMKFSIVVGFVSAVLLLAVPCGAQPCETGYVGPDEIADINCVIEGNFLTVCGTANLYPGAYVDWGIYAVNGCIINIYGGEIGDGWWIMLYSGQPSPVVTVYGTDFELDKVPLDPSATQFSVDPYDGGTLKGKYENGDTFSLFFLSDVPIYLQSTAAGTTTEMKIDIKPGNEQNNINLKSKGVVPVAILTTADFDATTVDPATAQFAGASPERWKLEDVDNDGDNDILFHFDTEQLNLDENSTEATLTAQLKSQTSQMTAMSMSMQQAAGGTTVSGSDVVRIVSPKKPKK